MAAHAQQAADLMSALGNRNRLMVLCALVDGELAVGELNARVPLSQSALSQQLAVLRKQDLVITRKQGQSVYYRLHGDKAQRVLALLKELFCDEEVSA